MSLQFSIQIAPELLWAILPTVLGAGFVHKIRGRKTQVTRTAVETSASHPEEVG
ncbi:hypothetical protein HDA44_004533 [Kribbella solani]|uniref:Uncharacterized protein n=1 Tax=Kribbella solani TaxID=236067 RepID=A0A841DRH9_9ACTN|nr:hypothetical protein [Kribbella solani]